VEIQEVQLRGLKVRSKVRLPIFGSHVTNYDTGVKLITHKWYHVVTKWWYFIGGGEGIS
jgi:hypothetical protein